MATRSRVFGSGIVALALGGMLAGCSDGGGTFRAFFGINGSGDCRTVVVDVDLDAADSVLARNGEAVDCALAAVLENDGCDVTFAELNGGILRVTINGCTIDDVSALFDCAFESTDLALLAAESTAQCTCSGQGCEPSPAVCVAAEEGPDGCEDCDNEKDDDGNDLVDCEDPNCEYASECGSVETTTTTSTTSTSVTITTTSTLPEGVSCTFRFHLDTDVTVGSMLWDTNYAGTGGQLTGEGADVDCLSLQATAITAFNDDDAGTLASGLVSVAGVDGPADLAECTFRGPSAPNADDFVVEVTEASLPDLTLIDPLPVVSIGNIVCDGVTTTTVTLPDTTTTTAPDTTTTTLPDGGDAKDYLVKFRLDSASASVGALQWSTDYSSATGEIQGSGATPACTANVALGALFAPNDIDAQQKLNLGLVALVPFAAPVDLVTCTFNGFSNDPPTAEDFPFTIEDKTDGNGDPIDAVISVTVTEKP